MDCKGLCLGIVLENTLTEVELTYVTRCTDTKFLLNQKIVENKSMLIVAVASDWYHIAVQQDCVRMLSDNVPMKIIVLRNRQPCKYMILVSLGQDSHQNTQWLHPLGAACLCEEGQD